MVKRERETEVMELIYTIELTNIILGNKNGFL